MRKIATLTLAALGALIRPFATWAADASVYHSAAVPPPPVINWAGFYAGGNVGGVWGNGTVSDSLYGLSTSATPSGLIGGGQLGLNFQYGFFVFGLEGEVDLTNNNSTSTGRLTAAGNLQASANTDSVSTLAGRFGVTYGPMLFYGKAGVGWVESTASITNVTKSTTIRASETNSGGLGGFGVEWAFVPNWSLKLEYDYLSLRSWTFTGPPFTTDAFTVSRNIQVVKAGFNYRFNWFNWGYPTY